MVLKVLLRNFTQVNLLKKFNAGKHRNLSTSNGLTFGFTYPAIKQHQQPKLKTLAIAKQPNPLLIEAPKVPYQPSPDPSLVAASKVFFTLRNVMQFLILSMTNLKENCTYKPLQDVLDNFLQNVMHYSENNLENLFFSMQYNQYSFKNLLHGWLGIKNDKRVAWSDILNELKKFSTPLRFANDEISQVKHFLIFKLTNAYREVEEKTPYLINAIDLHLTKIRACNSKQDLQQLFENSRDLSGQHSLKKMLFQYADVPTYAFFNNILHSKSFDEIYGGMLEELKPEIRLGIYLE